jgi:hypothetical protein
MISAERRLCKEEESSSLQGDITLLKIYTE